MFMKKIYMLLTALVMSVTAVAQQLMPPAFSTEADPACLMLRFSISIAFMIIVPVCVRLLFAVLTTARLSERIPEQESRVR